MRGPQAVDCSDFCLVGRWDQLCPVMDAVLIPPQDCEHFASSSVCVVHFSDSSFWKTDCYYFVQYYWKHGSREDSVVSRYQKDGSFHGFFKVLLSRNYSHRRVMELFVHILYLVTDFEKSPMCGLYLWRDLCNSLQSGICIHLQNWVSSNFCMQNTELLLFSWKDCLHLWDCWGKNHPSAEYSLLVVFL